MLLIQLEKSSNLPIYQQIIREIKKLIDSATLKTGYRLPSSRDLASKLGINRSTVYRAYQELWAQGYIDCTPGTYTTVRYRNTEIHKQIKKTDSKVDWEKRSSKAGKEVYQVLQSKKPQDSPSEKIDFVSLSPDPRLNPVDDFRRCRNQVMRNIGAPLLQYGDVYGYAPLRDFIAHRLRLYGMRLSLEEVLITNGVQQALNLICQFLLHPGSPVAVEEPTYSAILPVFSLYGAKAAGIRQGETGLDLDHLQDLIQKQKPAFLYTMPNFQNPTGITTTHAHREKLLSICEKAEVLIVEDGFEEELKYFGKAALPLKSMDRKGIVLYLGTFSKVLFPGLRIGWIAADEECISRLAALKLVNDTSGNIMEQAAVECYCRSGEYDIHVKRMHREYRKRMKTALSLAKQYIPAGHFKYTIPSGGYILWIEAKDPNLAEEEVVKHILQAGIKVSPGSQFFIRKSHAACFRISIAHCNQAEIEIGMKTLGNALSTFKTNESKT